MSNNTSSATGYPVSDGSATAGGMTLRDWFAGQAMAGMMANAEMHGHSERFAQWAYEQADAMLKARE